MFGELKCNADAINEANERENARVVAEATGRTQPTDEGQASSSRAETPDSSLAQQSGSRTRTHRLSLFGSRR